MIINPGTYTLKPLMNDVQSCNVLTARFHKGSTLWQHVVFKWLIEANAEHLKSASRDVKDVCACESFSPEEPIRRQHYHESGHSMLVLTVKDMGLFARFTMSHFNERGTSSVYHFQEKSELPCG